MLGVNYATKHILKSNKSNPSYFNATVISSANPQDNFLHDEKGIHEGWLYGYMSYELQRFSSSAQVS